jgi:hypothetical protein
MCVFEIPREFVSAQSEARPILRKVVADLVTCRHQPLYQLLLTLSSLRDHEEGRPGFIAV